MGPLLLLLTACARRTVTADAKSAPRRISTDAAAGLSRDYPSARQRDRAGDTGRTGSALSPSFEDTPHAVCVAPEAGSSDRGHAG